MCVYWYSERNMRMIQIQDNILEQKNLKDKLESEQEKLHVEYNKVKTNDVNEWCGFRLKKNTVRHSTHFISCFIYLFQYIN